MKSRFVFVVAAVATGMAGLNTHAATYSVTNYSWLQLAPDRDTASILGSGGATSGTAFGPTSAFRWGNNAVWIPSAAFTANGTSAYSATIGLDQSRDIKSVALQWYAQDGITISNYSILGSNDGTNFASIGSRTFGSPQTGNVQDTVTVTEGNYQYIRVSVPSTGYTTALNNNKGGPGLYMLDPIGDGTLSDVKGLAGPNWANVSVFGTSTINNGLDFNGGGYTSGSVREQFGSGTRAGDIGAWEAGDYAQIDLKAVRPLGESAVVWNGDHGGNAYDILYSNDGVNFLPVTGKVATTLSSVQGGLAYSFNHVDARYVRIANVTGGDGFTIMDQVLLFNDLPEPTTPFLMLGGAALLFRVRRTRQV
jgi:hypothetical protein